MAARNSFSFLQHLGASLNSGTFPAWRIRRDFTARIVSKSIRTALIAAIAGLTLSSAAGAATIFSENFNSSGFRGAFLQNDVTERFGPSKLYFAADSAGWDFANGIGGGFPFTLIATTTNGEDGAVWLQEIGTSASYTLTGLTAGKQYSVSFLQSGDHVEGASWTYDVAIDGGSIYSGGGTTLAAGTNPGVTINTIFTATGGTAVLKFADTAFTGGANVVIDNINVSAVPEPATWSLLITGFGLVGFAARRRRLTIAA